ncbi:MAG: hypothetical protein JWR61_3965 [Ferruginibacter sp.]|nr:hypothetical protein [Ferruginibacter sp.]
MVRVNNCSQIIRHCTNKSRIGKPLALAYLEGLKKVKMAMRNLVYNNRVYVE